VALICELAGGVATEDALDVYPSFQRSKAVTLRPARVEVVTGLKLQTEEMLRILTTLGFELRDRDDAQLAFIVPSWRHDVSIEEDLVEELARHTGYDQIQSALPPASMAGEYHASEHRKRALRNALSAQGYDEAVNMSFIERAGDFELIPAFRERIEAPSVILTNPIIEEASQMRQTLLPGLLSSIQHNINHGMRDVCLFELGRVFVALEAAGLPHERETLALAATGGARQARRAQADRELDFHDLKGALESAIEAMNLPPVEFEAAEARHLRPGQTASISANGTLVGSLGRLSEQVSTRYKFRQPVFVAEIDLTALLEMKELPMLYSPLPRFPSIVRDVSLLLERKVSLSNLLQAIDEHNVRHLIGAELVGTYEGEGIPEDKRSITVRLEYRADDRTLRDDEVDGGHWPLVKALEKKFDAEIR
jgi:phenylalanyl-tRNA synthetase beta chain